MTGRVLLIRLAVWVAVASVATTAAAAVVGTLNTGSAGTVTFSLGGITFLSDPSAVPPGPPWNSEVANGTVLTFAGGPLALTEGIQISAWTTTTVLPITSYLGFAAHPLLVFSLTSIGPGSPNTDCAIASATIGGSCSPFGGSPLVLTRVATGTAISFTVVGKASDSGTAGLATGSNYVGLFTAMVAGQTPFQIQQFFCPTLVCQPADFTSGKTITTTQSGEFKATAP